MDWPPDLAPEPARGDFPRATRNDACVVCAPRGRFVLGDLALSIVRTGSQTGRHVGMDACGDTMSLHANVNGRMVIMVAAMSRMLLVLCCVGGMYGCAYSNVNAYGAKALVDETFEVVDLADLLGMPVEKKPAEGAAEGRAEGAPGGAGRLGCFHALE